MNYETFEGFEETYHNIQAKLDSLIHLLQEFEWNTSTFDPDHPFDSMWMKEDKLVEILVDLEELKTEYEHLKVDALNILNVQEEYKSKVKDKCELFEDLLVIFKSMYGNVPPSDEFDDSHLESGVYPVKDDVGSDENLDVQTKIQSVRKNECFSSENNEDIDHSNCDM